VSRATAFPEVLVRGDHVSEPVIVDNVDAGAAAYA